MKSTFLVKPIQHQTIRELPGAWTNEDYKAVLALLDFEEIEQINEQELGEMCQMALTDLSPVEAAKILLEYSLGEILSSGQIQNLANEMLEDKMWEEFSNINCHEAIYNINQLLFRAFNGKFPQPKAMRIIIEVVPQKHHDEPHHWTEHISEPFLVSLLAAGMDEHSTIQRLFGEQLAKENFPEAASILWQFTKVPISEGGVRLEIIGSEYWLEDFTINQSYSFEWNR